MKLHQVLIMFYVLMIGISDDTYCQEYQYPVKPGSEEWSKLQTHDEMLQICQIPESVLLKMSTKDLLESCLNYPLLLDFLAYDDMKYGFETMSDGFNGFPELRKRKDAGKYLIAKYRSLNAEEIINKSVPSDRGLFTLHLSVVELILTDDNIIRNLNASDKALLVKEALEKYEMKVKHIETYGTFSQMTNVFLITRVLNTMGNKDWDLYVRNNNEVKSFTEKMMITTPFTLGSIVSESKKIIK